MVDTYGRWHEEEDYSTYPEEKWCDYDTMAAWIREHGYEPKTSMENLINMIFAHYECEIEDDKNNTYHPNNFRDCKDPWISGYKVYVEDNGGFEEFDYEA
ncbi:hypothetical protein DW722_07255 [Mediterraneibacter gnavus]|jgi:hypothetical protein|uniref:hypothetical protein n=1 Tax=Mediterraneibacter gnavus TaxID=33038 RepID=UPI000E544C4A|nr:hypothetical protein [Mediterraneibacter gnavus]RHE72434.1 hypothetical protein DW722_07255 [Mediterraneibacter gnavus]RHM40472.1 hypothetical protein DWZ70_03085 [Mediterraneibacter gnavus]